LEIRKELLGEKHTTVARDYNNIGVVYDIKNEYDLALQYYFKSLEINKELLGEKHADIASFYNNIGIVVNGNYNCTDFGNWKCTKNGNNRAQDYWVKNINILIA
jgi:tetratricopeptide (TPR) repeat protein